MRCHGFLAPVLFAALSTAYAQPIRSTQTISVYKRPAPAAQQPTAKVAALIQSLDDPARRDSAFNALLAIGQSVVPQLQWAPNKEAESLPVVSPTTPKTQNYIRGGAISRYRPDETLPRIAYHRITSLLERLEEQHHLKPTLIALNHADAPLKEILIDLGRQVDSDISITADSYAGPARPDQLAWVDTARATLLLNRVDFWTALRTIVHALPPTVQNEQYLQFGVDRVPLGPSAPTRDLALHDLGIVVSGPLLFAPSWDPAEPARITIRAAAEPGLHGVTGVSRVQLEQVLDDQGHSLLRSPAAAGSTGSEDKDFSKQEGYSWSSESGYRAWSQRIPIDPPGPGRRVATVRGQLSIGVSSAQTSGAIPLDAFDIPHLSKPPAETEIFVLENCQMLNPPSDDGHLYRSDAAMCCRRTLPRRQGNGAAADELLLTNTTAAPVTFVVSKFAYGSRVIADPAPAQPGDMAIFRLHAASGETVTLRVGLVYDRALERSAREPLPPVALKPSPHQQTAKFDDWTLIVLNIQPKGSLYTLTGELRYPLDAAMNTVMGPETQYVYLGLADRERWAIEHGVRFQKPRRDGDHMVEGWEITTREPGRIPATLIWGTLEATRWLTFPFDVRNLSPVR